MPDFIKNIITNPDFIKRLEQTNQNPQNQREKTLVNYM
jgi:hypothetical protein